MSDVITDIPTQYRQLLDRPLFAHLATVRPDGAPQVNPMWFKWDGEFLYFTHTSVRQKYRNITENPNVAISIINPEEPYRYLEVRGELERVDPDPEGGFYVDLARRYGLRRDTPPSDAKDRVMLVVRPTSTSRQ